MAKLQIEIEINDKGTATIRQLGQATADTGKKAEEASRGVAHLGQKVDGATTSVTGLINPVNLLNVAIGAGMVAALKSAVGEATQFADEIHRLQILTGSSIRNLAALVDVANDVGVEFGSVQMALLRLANQSEETDGVLAQLHLTAKDGVGRLVQLAQKLSGVTDANQRASIASEIFEARIAARLLPLIDRLQGGMGALGAETNEFANILGEGGVKALRDFGIAQGQVGDALLQLKIVIAKDLLPALNPLVVGLQNALELFAAIPSPVRAAVEVLGLAAGAITAVNVALRLFGIGILAMTGPVGWIALAVAGVAMLASGIDGLTGKLSRAWELFKQRGMVAPTQPETSGPPSPATSATGDLTIIPKDIREANAAVQKQIDAIKAERLELEQGKIAALQYSLAHGEMAKASSQLKAQLVGLTQQLQAIKVEQEIAADLQEALTKDTNDATDAIMANAKAMREQNDAIALETLVSAVEELKDLREKEEALADSIEDANRQIRQQNLLFINEGRIADERLDNFNEEVERIKELLQWEQERISLLERLKSLSPAEAEEQRSAALGTAIARLQQHKTELTNEAGLLERVDREILKLTADQAALNKETMSFGAAIEKTFSGILDILALFGVKVGKFILMLQNLPRAIGGIREVFAGLGGLMAAGGTFLGAGTAWAETAKSVSALGNASSETAGVLGFFSGTLAIAAKAVVFFSDLLSRALSAAGVPVGPAGMIGSLVTSGGIGFGLGSLIFGGSGGLGAGAGSLIGTGIGALIPGLGTQLLGQILGPKLFTALFATIGPMFTTMIGNIILPGIGFVIGGVLGKLFGGLFSGPTPQISGMVRLDPTTITELLAAQRVVPGQVVNPPGRSHFSYLESGPFYEEMYKHRTKGDLNREESQVAIMNVIIATMQAAIKGLTALESRMPTDALRNALSERIDAVLAAGFEVTDFNIKGKKTVEKFKEWLQQLSGATLEAFTTQLFPSIDLAALGAGDAVKGFDVLTTALADFSDLLVRSGHATAFAGDTLDEFATRSVDFFRKFQKEGEALADTMTRVTNEVGNLITQLEQFRTSTNQFLLNLQTQISTLSMQSGGGLGEFNLLRQVAPGIIGGLPRDLQLQLLGPLIASLVSQAKTAIETGQPLGDILTGRQSIIDWGVALFGKLQQESDPVAAIQGLQTLASGAQELLAGEIEAVNAYYRQLIAQEQARLTTLEQERQALQGNTDALEAEIAAVKAASEARLAPLKEEQQLLQDQLSLLRDQAQALQAWQEVVTSVRKQLLDMRLASDNPQNALERLALAQQAVVSAKAAFASQGTPETAKALQTALGDELKIAQEAFRRPSDAYQKIFDQVSADLQAIQSVAESNAGDLESLTRQIVEKQAHLTALTEQIQTIERDTANAVRPLDASLNALKAANEARLTQIQAEEAQVRATIQERITSLQSEQAALITQFRQEAVGWLQSIRNEAFVRLEQAIREGNARIAELLGLPHGSSGAPPPNPQIAQAANALMSLAQLAQGGGLANLATAIATSSRFITAGALPDAITAAMRALSIAQMTPDLMFPSGQEAISRFAGIIDAAKANQFDQAVNGLDTLLTFLHNIGLTSMVPVPGFAEGLKYVPRDDFVARLHRGERVLTADENRAYSGGPRGGDTITISFSPAIHVTVQGDESPEAMRRKVDEATADLLTTPSRTRAALVRFAKEHQ